MQLVNADIAALDVRAWFVFAAIMQHLGSKANNCTWFRASSTTQKCEPNSGHCWPVGPTCFPWGGRLESHWPFVIPQMNNTPSNDYSSLHAFGTLGTETNIEISYTMSLNGLEHTIGQAVELKGGRGQGRALSFFFHINEAPGLDEGLAIRHALIFMQQVVVAQRRTQTTTEGGTRRSATSIVRFLATLVTKLGACGLHI